jgi:CheY-like chemotaxis protein
VALDLLIEGAEFDLILCDLHMPETTGMDVWEEIRRVRPGLEQRFIFMTAGVFSDRALQFAKSVGNAILEKPLNLVRIREIIHRLQQRGRGGPAA